MKTLRELIIESLEDSIDLIEITRLGMNCDHELKIDFEAMAQNVIYAQIHFLEQVTRGVAK